MNRMEDQQADFLHIEVKVYFFLDATLAVYILWI